jgi:hypothetical protein
MSAGKFCIPVCFLLSVQIYAVQQQHITPFETATWPVPTNQVDAHVLAALDARGIKPARPCSDAVFIRRVYLDVIGTLPEPDAVRAFLRDRRPDKRSILIDELLAREEFADYWSMKWADLLRVKAEFPINLWPNAVQAYHRWIHDAMKQNMPYNQFARALLTTSGSNFREPPVNFYRAVQGKTPSAIAGAVALTFMGSRFDQWPKTRQDGMAAFFSRIAYKSTAEWKEEIVCLDATPTNWINAVFPDGKSVRISPLADPRQVFADWLISDDNTWFARALVNRAWYWLMGRGIIHEPDDIRADNPALHPELLTCLEKSFIVAKYDIRELFRLILNSRTYQQSPIPRSTHQDAEALCACYPVRRLDAEVLIDMLNWLCDSSERYSSAVPEPFTFIPENQRTIALADGSITSPFLEMFGRPARDTGLESERSNQPTTAQRLHLLNASAVQNKIQNSKRLRRIFQRKRRKPRDTIEAIYLTILSRRPTQAEVSTIIRYFTDSSYTRQQAASDLVWSLINSKEFLYKH